MSVTKKDVEYVAELSRLSFSEKEKEALIEDLNKVLGYVEKLNTLDTEDVEIIVNPIYMENKFREDEVEPSMPLTEVLQNAPQKLDSYILVPKVLD